MVRSRSHLEARSASDTWVVLSTEESTSMVTATTGERTGTPLTTASRPRLPQHHRAALPVVHIRARPTLTHLGETKEQRRVWCLDHQNIVVRSNKTAPERHHTVSPARTRADTATAPLSPRCHSTSPVRGGGRRGRALSCTPKDLGTPSPLCPPPAKETPRERYRSIPRSRGASAVLAQSGGKPAAGISLADTVSPRRCDGGGREEHFTFDFIHGEDVTQEEVFEESILDFVDMALLAQSVAIICYGPTGSGKTYSMMGSTRSQPGAKRTSRGAQGSTPVLDKQQPPRSKSGSKPVVRGECSPKSFWSSTTTGTSGGGNTAAATATWVKGQKEKHQQRRKTHTPERTTDATGSSLSSVTSPYEIEWSGLLDSGTSLGCEGKSGLSGSGRLSSQSAAEKMAITGGGTETMGLLPRFVFVLLERCGEPITLDREEAAMKTPSGNRSGGVKDKAPEQRRHNVTLTLREITFYGVELYMDEFRDLLDPSKRPIPNVGDIGGLDAFCEKMNKPTPSTPRGGSGSGCGGGSNTARTSSNTPFRGGGMPVSSVDDLRRCYSLASRNRVTKGHQRNDTSSRSHAVFILQLRFDLTGSRRVGNEAPPKSVYSYVAMVDLAGSERVKDTKVEGAALREAQYINKSLSALSSVLLALYQRSSHVPYRDSKLTRLLRPCLEWGRVLTLVHVTPCSAEETINCLKFAEQVRHTSVQTHSFLNVTDELVAVFEDLNDPQAEERSEAYRRSELEYAQLCAEVRLAYLDRGDNSLTPSSLLLHGGGAAEAAEAAAAAAAEGGGGGTGATTDSFDVLTSRRNFAHVKMREYAIGVMLGRHMFRYRMLEDEELQEAAAELGRERDRHVEEYRRQKENEVESLKLVIEQLRCYNAQLAEENSQPVLRDAHAMAIKQRLKDISAEITNHAKEKLLLSEGIRAIRQRLALQDDLELCLDEQLRDLEKHTNADGTVTRQPVDGNVDEEMGAIYQQQLLLSKEMSLLRKESTCFVLSDEVWEGLWARVMRQELLLAHRIEMEMLDSIVLQPGSLRWALEATGLAPDTAKTAVHLTPAGPMNVDRLLEMLKAEWSQMSGSLDVRGGGDGENSATVAAIPLTLSNSDEVKSVHTLIGSYNDEARLQEMSVKKLLNEGIHCEAVCLAGGINVDELRSRNAPLASAMRDANHRTQWGCLRLVHPPKDASSSCLEFSQRTHGNSDKVRERRIISIPLGEPQLRILLHVIEAESMASAPASNGEGAAPTATVPLFALELLGVPPAAQQQQQEDGGTKSRGHMRLPTPRLVEVGAGCMLNGGENAAARNIVLTKRLDCGGELLLPAACMADCEEGSGTIVFHFPESLVATSTRTEAVECVVAALSGLTVPALPLSFTSSSSTHQPSSSYGEEATMESGINIVTYQHVPHILLNGYGAPLRSGVGAGGPTLVRGPGMPPLGYTTSMQVRFYFPKERNTGALGNSAAANNTTTAIVRSPRARASNPLEAVCAILNRLGALTLPSNGSTEEGATAEENEIDLILSRLQQLHAFRKKTRAKVRQQIFDAEDIKAELLYSYSEGEFMRGSHIKDVLKEARELVDLQQLRGNCASCSRVPVRATPGLCRELCGAAVPWTVWQWAHRWKSLRETYAHQQQQSPSNAYILDNDDSLDDSEDGVLSDAVASARESNTHSSTVFEELPCFLSSME
ncbi:kinesin [Trypanosoma grayi]|uniref:kinesin n=1 Tax=Trypanosoma grayi TaxID=71804 RepID=UPI0004F41839|nr:kinesin [Trypanosoma grayi]KEG12038.1 kinesin [Trypanosoma grayi]